MTEVRPKCLKCGGKVIREGNELKCINCGQEWKTPREKGEWYKSHLEEILADLKELGRTKACKKWLIPIGTISKLIRRWDDPNPEDPVPVRTPHADITLPGLPAFSDTWPEVVQLKWLETYLAILIYSKKEA